MGDTNINSEPTHPSYMFVNTGNLHQNFGVAVPLRLGSLILSWRGPHPRYPGGAIACNVTWLVTRITQATSCRHRARTARGSASAKSASLYASAPCSSRTGSLSTSKATGRLLCVPCWLLLALPGLLWWGLRHRLPATRSSLPSCIHDIISK